MMTFHSMKSKEDRERDTLPHPIWRGVGVVMIFVVPILSFVISDELIKYWDANIPEFILPYELSRTIDVPIYGEVDNFFGVLALAVIVTIAFFSLFSVVNAIVYRTTREQNLRVFESRPQKYKRKRKLRKAKDRYKSSDDLF
jgi:hypothetical protein